MTDFLLKIQNAVSMEDGVPKHLKILPLGLVKSQKGDFLVDEESFASIRQDFRQRQLQIPIDYEHQTLKDMQAPAAGWIKELSLKPDGIYGLVEWTPKAAEFLTNKEYKYCSPVIMARSSDRKAVKLHSVALTNTPAIDAMTPIVNSSKPEDMLPNGGVQKPSASMETLAQLLQLPATATIEDIYQAVSQLLGTQTTLKLEVDTLQFQAHKALVENTVELALREGKIAPFQREWAFQSAMNSYDDFTLWLKNTPTMVPMGRIVKTSGVIRNGELSRSDELLGLTPGDMQQYRQGHAKGL
ncbi:MAG: phage protease [Oscillospiraceae bacterium]